MARHASAIIGWKGGGGYGGGGKRGDGMGDEREVAAQLTHFEVKELALMLKKVAPAWHATHLPIRVLPVPGGPV